MEKKERQDYSELLKDPRWQKRRTVILNRDNWTCQICGATDKTLHVHHTIYLPNKKPWEYIDTQLITLCEDCHEQEHEYAFFVDNEIKRLRESGLTMFEIHEALIHIDFQLFNDDYYLSKMCHALNSKGEPFKSVNILTSLAERRKLIKDNSIENDLH